MRYLLRIDWDVVAGIIAAVVAMLLSFMGLVSETVGRGIILLLCALLLIRDLRGEAREHRMFDKLDVIKRHVATLAAAKQPGIHLVGSKKMRQEFADFATTVHGEVRWYNACCRMFRRPEVFNATLRPFLENPNVTTIHLICRPDERQSWLTDLLPKLRKCDQRHKVRPPLWGGIRTDVSFVLGDVDGDGRDEAVMAILEEPFSTAAQGPAVPRFLIRVFSHCDLIAPLEDMSRHAMSDFEPEDGVPEHRSSIATDEAYPPPRDPPDPPAA